MIIMEFQNKKKKCMGKIQIKKNQYFISDRFL